ncbi:MAG TPA: hypothetical protein VF426_06005 [Marmoricola sp.]
MKRNLFKAGMGGVSIAAAAAMVALSAGPALAATGSTGEGDSSAATGTGLFKILDTGKCAAEDTATTDKGTPTGRCGDGLNLNNQISAFSQNGSAPGDGTSTADASVAPIDLTNLGTSLDLGGIVNGLSAIDTGTILDGVIGGATSALQPVLKALEPTVLAPLNSALQTALGAVTKALPITVSIGAVNAQCSAEPGTAKGDSTVAGIDLNVSLGGQVIKVPMKLSTTPNSNLLVGSPKQLVNGIIAGLEDTFTSSLGGVLDPLNNVLSTVQSSVTNTIFDQLEASLLPAVANALSAIIKGTVNEQDPVSPSTTGQISVTALDLTILGSNNLKLARTHCGPNTRKGEPTPSPSPSNSSSPSASPSGPVHPDGGLAGNGGHADVILAAVAALLAMAGAGGTLAYRRYGMPRG